MTPTESPAGITKDIAMQNKGRLDATQAAADWEKRGVFCVPLHESSKKPKTKEWQHLRLVSDDFGRAFRPGDNIGGLWGQPSNWAVDVDLDLSTAPAVAQHLLKNHKTFIYGRRNKRASHYLFRCVDAETKKWQITGKDQLGMVIEIRSTGAQSVLPPSRHPEGDRYFIEDDTPLFEVSKLDLEMLCDEIAIAAVFLFYYPEKGQHGRHDFVHACTGTLCHANWDATKIKRVMGAVLSEVVGEDEEMQDRKGSVVNTIARHADGSQIKGLTSLVDFMTPQATAKLRMWLKSGEVEAQLEEEPVNLKTSRARKEPTFKGGDLAFKSEWLDIPGLIGDIARWSHKRSYLQQPIFDLATGITCTAYASSNKYIVQGWDTPISPYLMVTAPTGGGKDAVIAAISEFSRAIGLSIPYKGFQSYYVLLDTLAEEGNVCLVWDEAARNLLAAKNINGPDFQTITHILSLYGAGTKVIGATPGRKQTIPELVNPFFTLLATAQPQMLMEAITSAAQETGFVNRFLLFDSGSVFPPLNRQREKVFPASLLRQGRAMLQHEPERDFTEITFKTSRAYSRFQAFEEASRRRSMAQEYTWARANQNALILAGVAAVGIDPHRPQIDEYLTTWAIGITEWSCNCWDEKIRMVGGGSEQERQSKQVENMIRHPEECLGLARHPTQHKQRELMIRGLLPRAVLVRGTRRIGKYRLEEILNSLHEGEVIGSSKQDLTICYFAKI
jgi:hypothetical protein